MAEDEDRLSAVFGALADPTRRAILGRLVLGEASVAELAQPFDLSVRAISKHIAVLERAGLLTRSRDAQRRPSKIVIASLHEAETWIGYHVQLWEKRLSNIDRVLKDAMAGRSRQ